MRWKDSGRTMGCCRKAKPMYQAVVPPWPASTWRSHSLKAALVCAPANHLKKGARAPSNAIVHGVHSSDAGSVHSAPAVSHPTHAPPRHVSQARRSAWYQWSSSRATAPCAAPGSRANASHAALTAASEVRLCETGAGTCKVRGRVQVSSGDHVRHGTAPRPRPPPRRAQRQTRRSASCPPGSGPSA